MLPFFGKLPYAVIAIFSSLAVTASATTVVVNGLADVAGTSYANLSTAVAYVQSTGPGPHIVNVTSNQTPGADGQLVITTGPLTINGDADADGNKCDILVDLAGITTATVNLGTSDRTYMEIQCTTGPVVVRDLKIHPNADCVATDGTAVDAIIVYKPTGASDVGDYLLERVWVSGSTAANAYVPLDTNADLYNTVGIKRWTRDVNTQTAAVGHSWAAIQMSNANGAGKYVAELRNCHVGLSRSSAINVNSAGCTVTLTGGIYGHSMREAIHADNTPIITLQGTATNRLRVVRVPNQSAKDAHGVELLDANLIRMEYVDVATILSGNNFKVNGTGTAGPIQYCRFMGKLDSGATSINSTFYAAGTTFTANLVRKCTFVGGGSNYNPAETNAAIFAPIQFTDCIFSSEGSGQILAQNSDSVGGFQSFTNCALPTDAFPGESLNATTPVINASGAFLPTQTNTLLASPHYVQTVSSYNWSEAAVSIDGSNASAGNPNVLRPSTASYNNAASDVSDLTGGAGGDIGTPLTAARDWSLLY